MNKPYHIQFKSSDVSWEEYEEVFANLRRTYPDYSNGLIQAVIFNEGVISIRNKDVKER